MTTTNTQESHLPEYEDRVRYLGESLPDVIPCTDLIVLGFLDTNRIEYYIGDRAGDYYIRLLPHHALQEIGWKNQYTLLKEGDAQPVKPRNCIWTNCGCMYALNTFFDRQYEHLMHALHTEALSKINIFAGRRKKPDPWS